MMNFNRAMEYINGTIGKGIKYDLNNMRLMMELTGRPERSFRAVHISGTNGKGSTSAMIASVLREAGYRVGLYTSPHLVHFRERIQFDGKEISEEDLASIVSFLAEKLEEARMKGASCSPTYFEMATAIGFNYFARKGVEFAVVEVGMGGRLDSTNVMDAEVAVITRIDLEHTRYLGHDRPSIAREKAGIIKKDSSVVVGAQEMDAFETLKNEAIKKQARCFISSMNKLPRSSFSCSLEGVFSRIESEVFGPVECRIPLIGAHQHENFLTALTALEELSRRNVKLDVRSVVNGIEKTKWPGRFEIVRKEPYVILDGAHNPGAMRVLAGEVSRLLSGRPVHLVISILRDKNIDEMMGYIVPLAERVIVTEIQDERKSEGKELLAAAARYSSNVILEKNPGRALEMAINDAGSHGAVLVTGSLYLVGELKRLLNGGK